MAIDAPCRPVRAVVFDLDGTLVDSYDAITDSLNHARAGWRLPPLPASFVRGVVGRGLEALIEEHVGPDRVEDGVRRFRERYAEVFVDGTRVLPGVASALRRLHARGLSLALASNKPARFSRPILRSFGLLDAFTAVHGPDTVGVTKPDPAMIRRCLADLGSRPEQALYVGDMVLDVESGRRAGVDVVLVRGGSSTDEDLAAAGVPVVSSLEVLADLVQPARAEALGGTP